MKFTAPILLPVLISLAGTTAAEAAPIYKESFHFCGPEEKSYDALSATGWSALKSGRWLGKGGYLKVSAPGSADLLAPLNSNPTGPDNGRLLWTALAPDGLLLFTDEISIDISSIGSVRYQQLLDGIDHLGKDRDVSHLAFLIGDTWFISDHGTEQAGRVWQNAGFQLQGMTFGTSHHFAGIGPTRPHNSGVQLPASGTVRAFGVFIWRGRGRVRIDNFAINDTAPQDTMWDDTVPPLSCAVPVEPTLPPPVDPGKAAAAFCPIERQGKKHTVKISDRFQRKLFASIRTSDRLKAARDKALIGLLPFFGRDLRLLSELSVSKYTEISLAQNGQSVRWSNAAAAVRHYLLVSGIDNDGPLFRQVPSVHPAALSQGMCASDIARVISRRAANAGIRKRVRFLP